MLNKIEYPKRESEFEVQSALYQKLLTLGFNVRGSVPAKVFEQYDKKRHKCYLDIVVFDINDEPRAIIEVKNSPNPKDKSIGSRQTRRYQSFGVPLLVCKNLDQIEETVNEMDQIEPDGAAKRYAKF